MRIKTALLIGAFHLFSCSDLSMDTMPRDEYEGTAQIVVIESIDKTAENLENYCAFDGKYYSAQGVSVIGNTLFRLYDTGLCKVYDISDLSQPRILSTFQLGSRNPNNHCNCSQIRLTSTGDTLLYVAGLSGKCFVERLSISSSTLVQTITLPPMSLLDNSQSMNMICGDDGFLWLFGESRSTRKLFFARVRLPELSEGDVVLKPDDILDCWSESNYVYTDSVWQGGMVYNGNLYYVFGRGESNRHIAIYNVYNHKKVNDIILNGIVTEEPEDCEMIGEYILLSIYDGTGLYLLRLSPDLDS